MEHRNRQRTPRLTSGLLIAALVALAVAACGGGSDQAKRLLRQTFAGSHRIQSGRLGVRLTVSPSGASTSKGAIAFSLAGPFQTVAPGRMPASAFDVSVSALGSGAAVTITSTGSTGYVTFQGRSYELPRATFQRLESSFAQVAAAPGRGRGFHPERWLSNPQVVGKATIQGVNTVHIRSGVNVPALLADLDTFLRRASASGIAGAGVLPRPIAGADRRRFAGEVKNPTVNVWTGAADKTLRRLEIDLRIAVTGRLSTLLGRSAAIALSMQYADLNQPQSITAPARVLPYAQFQAKLRVLVGSVGSGLISGGGGAASGG